MAENVVMHRAWQDVVAAATLSAGDERTLVAVDGAIEIFPAPTGAEPPTDARGDVLYPGSFDRAADRPLYTAEAGAKLWARLQRGSAAATLVLTET